MRHAHSTYTSEELKRPLSVKGSKDAIKVKELLLKENIEHVISSPYLRAIQTVEGLANTLGEEIHIMNDFRERKLTEGFAINFEEAIRTVWDNPLFSWEGGESNKVAQHRGIRGMEIVLEQYKNKNVAIGTHGNIMVLTMNYFDQQYDFEFWEKLAMPDIYKLSFRDKKLVDCNRLWKDYE
ncbi:2,3-bisphosphoglycerate-dependent phosphoglycerate mutase [Bacillus mesophilus]|uniref:Histidine phosphatase family protein n=1 Tax=Bacillus mesophilus TaxID=1808955 RepID=A0A6M0Q7G8_9BACI|nr:histidine phosphatase family protein [Bacillus mesophilus]MBM7661076.1 2,3-bisphosphoglycerate-dependent phosphoglycerate mutase [Bacillus mesophilus]NEY71390.1 histidine phosphatase family protein [Bacillus mesophilus]